MKQAIRWKNILSRLLCHTLFLLSLILAGMITAESFLPWFITSKIPFSAILLGIILNLAALSFLKTDTKHGVEKNKEPFRFGSVWFLSAFFVCFLALAGSTIRYGFSMATLIVVVSIAIIGLFVFENSNT